MSFPTVRDFRWGVLRELIAALTADRNRSEWNRGAVVGHAPLYQRFEDQCEIASVKVVADLAASLEATFDGGRSAASLR